MVEIDATDSEMDEHYPAGIGYDLTNSCRPVPEQHPVSAVMGPMPSIGLSGETLRTVMMQTGVKLSMLFVIFAVASVHFAQAQGGFDAFLAVKGKAVAVVGELLGLDKHPAGASSGVKDDALGWLQHFHQQFNNRARGVELSSLFASAKANSPRKYSNTRPRKSPLPLPFFIETLLIRSINPPRFVGSRLPRA